MAERNYQEAWELYKKAYELDSNYKKGYIEASKELGVQALVDQEYDAAQKYLNTAAALQGKQENKLDFLIWLSQNHKLYKGVKPEYAHSILAVFFRHTDADVTDFNDKTFHVTADISDDQIKDSETTHTLFRMIIETFTRGRLTLNIDTMVVDRPVTVINSLKRPAKNMNVYEPAAGSLPGLGEITAERAGDVDTFFFYWAAGNLSARSSGGTRSFGVIPYTLSAPQRGFVILPGRYMRWSDYSGAYLHEFGHVIENFKVGRTHALYPERIEETRKLYPGFTGTFEAFWWKHLFEKQIPDRMEALSKAKKGMLPPYRNLNYRLRKKDDSLKSKYDACRPYLKDVTNDMLKKARSLYRESQKASKKKDSVAARQSCEELYALNPSIVTMYQALKMNHCCRVLDPDYTKYGSCK